MASSVPLIDLPKYVGSPLLDLVPINNALKYTSDLAQKGYENDLRNRQFDITKQQADITKRDSDLSYAEKQRRQAQYEALFKGPPPAGVTPAQWTALAALGAEQAPSQLANLLINRPNEDAKRRLTEAQARYYDAYTSERKAKAADVAAGPATTPAFAEYGIDPKTGEMIWIGGPSAPPTPAARYLPGASGDASGRHDGYTPAGYFGPSIGAPAPPVTQARVTGVSDRRGGDPGTSAHGPVGTVTTEVPGIVTTPSGKPSESASSAARGQSATDTLAEQARARALEYKQIQDFWSYMNNGQKPGAGKAYSADGRIVPLDRKESVQDTGAVAMADMGLAALDQTEKLLTGGRPKNPDGTVKKDGTPVGGSTYWTQYGSIPGYMMSGRPDGFGEAGKGFRAGRVAAMNLAFSLSGKSVSNKEHEIFTELFTPTPTDSLETQQSKIDMMRDYFHAAKAARKRGASDEELGTLFRMTLAEGQARATSPPTAQPGARQPSASPPTPSPAAPAAPPRRLKFNPATGELE